MIYHYVIIVLEMLEYCKLKDLINEFWTRLCPTTVVRCIQNMN